VKPIGYPKIFRHQQSLKLPHLTCKFIEQPLNHFSLPRDQSPTFIQRYCFTDEFVSNPRNETVFLYTGNESPLEEYINNTGLMWEFAQSMNAKIVFIEHRYEGQSLPNESLPNCMAYASSVQALADYANFIETHLFANNGTVADSARRPVITFGGSYGGMLSSWMRMKYPNLVAGAIAGSAPIWGFPLNFPNNIDGTWQVVSHGLRQPYPPTASKEMLEPNFCFDNLLSAWPIISYLSESSRGRSVLSEVFRLCQPLSSKGEALQLLSWAQTPWFDLAEGSFPYPSIYIPFALTHSDVAMLPAWPLQSACWKNSSLSEDLGIGIDGEKHHVHFDITFQESNFSLAVVWDKVVSKNDDSIDSALPIITTLLANVRNAVSTWYNVTHDVPCFQLSPAPNSRTASTRPLHAADGRHDIQCQAAMKQGSWPALCCNEEMNLIITESQGLGRDFIWPPSHAVWTHSHSDVLVQDQDYMRPCPDPEGIFGFPQTSRDGWATSYDILYGGTHIQSHSRIVFSNGLLDPWSSAGVFSKALLTELSPGLYQQLLNDRDLVALVLDYGGHHTDLMFSDTRDHSSFKKIRQVEMAYVQKWAEEWWESRLFLLDVDGHGAASTVE